MTVKMGTQFENVFKRHFSLLKHFLLLKNNYFLFLPFPQIFKKKSNVKMK